MSSESISDGISAKLNSAVNGVSVENWNRKLVKVLDFGGSVDDATKAYVLTPLLVLLGLVALWQV